MEERVSRPWLVLPVVETVVVEICRGDGFMTKSGICAGDESKPGEANWPLGTKHTDWTI